MIFNLSAMAVSILSRRSLNPLTIFLTDYRVHHVYFFRCNFVKCSVDGRIVSINMCNRDLDEVSET